MFAKLIVVGVLDLVEVVLVQLPDKRGEIGVFEHPGQDRFRKFIHVFDDKTIASGTPRNHVLEVWIFEHPNGSFSRCREGGQRATKAYLYSFFTKSEVEDMESSVGSCLDEAEPLGSGGSLCEME